MTATEGATRSTRDRAPAEHQAPVRRVSLNDDRWPDWLAAFAFVLSTVVVVAWLVPPLNRFFDRSDDPVSLAVVPIVPNLVYAAVLFALGVGLRRRLRSAWWAFVVLLLVLPSIGRVASLAGDDRDVLDAVGLVVAVALLVVAVVARRQFIARTARRAGLTALLVFVLGAVVVSLVGSWLLTTFANADSVGAGDAVANVLLGDLGLVANPGVRRTVVGTGAAQRDGRGRRARQRGRAVPVTALHPHAGRCRRGRGPHAAARSRRPRLARLLRHPPRQGRRVGPRGPGAGARRRLLPRRAGRSAWPAATRSATPSTGPPRSSAWRRDARANGWSLAVMGGRVRGGAAAYAEAGLTAFEIGDEAILDLGAFSLNGPGMKPVRQAVTRLQRRGYDDRGAPPRRADARRTSTELAAAAASVARRRRGRARLLDGARPARRPARRRLRAGRGARRRRAPCAASSASCRGDATASRST